MANFHMYRRWAVEMFVGLAVAVASVPAAAEDLTPRPLAVGRGERLLVVAPHPDDETLGAGGLVQHVLAHGGSVLIVLVTSGDGYVEAVIHQTGSLRPRPSQFLAYGEHRIGEARAAVHDLGDDRLVLDLLGFPDGGLQPLLHAYWPRTRPERSVTTEVSEPPYPNAEHPEARYAGTDLVRALVRCFAKSQPTLVALPYPLDVHPDHGATGVFTLLALHEWTGSGTALPVAKPRLLAYLVHWPHWPPGWEAATSPSQSSEAPLELPETLPSWGRTRTALVLTAAEISTKRTAFGRYESQQQEMASFLATFIRKTEPFTVLKGDELQYVEHLREPPQGAGAGLTKGPRGPGAEAPREPSAAEVPGR